MTLAEAYHAAFDGRLADYGDFVGTRKTDLAAPHRAPILDQQLNLRGEVLSRDALPMLLPAWEDLCGRAGEDNVYYTPGYALALLNSVDQNKDVGFAVVRDKERLLALLPFTRTLFRVPGLQPVARAWETKYTYSCTPLLDEHRKAEAASALLDLLRSIKKGEWIVPSINTDGETCRAMLAALDAKGLPWSFSNQFERASLEPNVTFEEHMKRHVSSNRRKGLARNRRRLEQHGPVAHECHYSGEGLERALEAFLAIEAGGWKGKRGTALACDEQTIRFAQSAFTGRENSSICRADVLKLKGSPIAVSLIACAGRTGFAVKTCYDEFYRSYSPGLLLEVEIIRSFLSERWANRLDAATAEAHVIDTLWPGRVPVADLSFSLSPRQPRLRLHALNVSERLKKNVRSVVKQSLDRLSA